MNASLSTCPLRVIQITDPHLFSKRGQRLLNVDTDASLTGVLDHIQTHEMPIDVMLATGDIAQDGSQQAYLRFLELAQPLAPVLRGLPGNHDIRKTFYDTWGHHAQAVSDIGHWRLIMLDSTIPGSNAGSLAPDQLDLLKQASETAEGRHVLVAMHHNPLPMGSSWLDTMTINNGNVLFDLIHELTNIRGLIWGHVHQEFDSVYHVDTSIQTTPDQSALRLLSAPATCMQFTPNSQKFSLDDRDPGYRRLELHPDGRIHTEVVRVSGLGIQPDASSKGY